MPPEHPHPLLPRRRVLRAGAALAVPASALGLPGLIAHPGLLGPPGLSNLAGLLGNAVRAAYADSTSVDLAGTAAAPAVAPATAFLPATPETERYLQKWALSCEYAATHIALRLLDFDVPEDTMLTLMGSGEDPDETFRGEIQANQDLTDYGIHARGIAVLIDRLKRIRALPDRVEARLLHTLDEIELALGQGQPVVSWVPLDLRASSRVPVRLSTGKVVNLVPAEHALALRGYDGSRVLAIDPHAGAPVAYDTGAFVRAMSLFDDPALAISLRPLAPVAPPVPTSEHFAETDVTLDGGFYRTYRNLGGRDLLGLPLMRETYEADAATGADKMVVYTETARLEWYPQTGGFGVGFVGQEFLGDGAALDPNRRLGGAIGQFVAQHGGMARFGYSLSEEVPITPGDDLLPDALRDASDVVGQWFQTGLVLYSRRPGPLFGRAGYALAKQRGIVT